MKSPDTLVGIPFFDAILAACGECTLRWEDCVVKGKSFYVGRSGKVKLATVTGPVSHLLQGKRTALHSLSHCSGVATLLSECVRIAKSQRWAGEVAGTRKTTPGFRLVEKYSLLVGGASTHRLDLSQMVMLKDNHIWSCGGSIEAAVKKARGVSGFCQSLEDPDCCRGGRRRGRIGQFCAGPIAGGRQGVQGKLPACEGRDND
jgi:nicotinate-nucleotide pyrophosphorylase (carboxylating)